MKTKNISSILRYAVAVAFALASSYAVTPTAIATPRPTPTPRPPPPTPTPTPCGIHYTPVPQCSNPTFTLNVCAHDGYELVTDVYLKDTYTLRPVLVVRGGGARCVIVPVLSTIWPADADYNLVVQDIRPSGALNSGNFIFSADQDDGQALLEQIAAPNSFARCNGRIAMQGGSNAGIVDYLAAPGAVASLRGIKAEFATGDLLNYGFFNGGVLHNETASFPSPAPTATPSWKDYAELPIWNNYLITDHDAGSANVAGLHRGGWFDVFGQGTLDSFSRLQTAMGPSQGRQKVVIGPWTHGGNGIPDGKVGELTFPHARIDDAYLNFSDYDAAWKECVFDNDCAAWDDTITRPAVKVYHMGAPLNGEWRTYTTWPPPAQEYPLYFASGGNLLLPNSTPPPNPGQVPFTSNPADPCPTRGGTNNLISCVWPSPAPPTPTPPVSCGPFDQRPIEAREHDPIHQDVTVFTSIPTSVWIVGRIYADVWIQTNLPDVDVFVRMTDVYPGPDNRSMLMAQGIQRARYRNGVCPMPLNLTQPTRVRVDLGSTALVLPAGHKLRVIVSASAGAPGFGPRPSDPLYDINPQNGDEYYIASHPRQSGSISILYGTGQASALVIPIPTGQTLPPDHRPNTTPCPPPK